MICMNRSGLGGCGLTSVVPRFLLLAERFARRGIDQIIRLATGNWFNNGNTREMTPSISKCFRYDVTFLKDNSIFSRLSSGTRSKSVQGRGFGVIMLFTKPVLTVNFYNFYALFEDVLVHDVY